MIMLNTDSSVAEGDAYNTWSLPKSLLLHRRYVGNYLTCLGMLMACLMCARLGLAQIVEILPGGERKNLVRLIASGTTPIDIRAATIQDHELVSAILDGSRTRRICVLVDRDSPELRELAEGKNVRVRFATAKMQGRFGKDKLSYSFVLEIGKGYYRKWTGPLTWTKSAFRPVTHFLAGSGESLWEPWAAESQTFDRDFSVSLAGLYPFSRCCLR